MITYLKEDISLKYICRLFWESANQFVSNVSKALLELGVPICLYTICGSFQTTVVSVAQTIWPVLYYLAT